MRIEGVVCFLPMIKTLLIALLGFGFFNLSAQANPQIFSANLDAFYVDQNSIQTESSPDSVVFKSLCDEKLKTIHERFIWAVIEARLNFLTQFKFEGNANVLHWMDGSGFRGMSCDVQLMSLTAKAQFVTQAGDRHMGADRDTQCKVEEQNLLADDHTLVTQIMSAPGTIFRKATCWVSSTQIVFN